MAGNLRPGYTLGERYFAIETRARREGRETSMPDEDVQFVADHFPVVTNFRMICSPVYRVADHRGITKFTSHMSRHASRAPIRAPETWQFSGLPSFPDLKGSFLLYRYFCSSGLGYIGISRKPLTRHKGHSDGVKRPKCNLRDVVVAHSNPEYLLANGRLATFATRADAETKEKEAIWNFAALGWRLVNKQLNSQWNSKTRQYDWLEM